MRIAVTSGKGGAGCSCVAAYTAAAFAKSGLKTLLIECGRGYRSLDVITGVTDVVYDLSDVLGGSRAIEDAVAQTALSSNLYLLPYGAPSGNAEVPLQDLIAVLPGEYDCIIADGVDFSEVDVKNFDAVLLVTTPDILSIRACAHLSAVLHRAGAKPLRLVINRVPPNVLPMQGIRDFDDVIDKIGAQLLGVIPESPKLHVSANNSLPLMEDSLTTQVFDSIAARLRGKFRPLLVK